MTISNLLSSWCSTASSAPRSIGAPRPILAGRAIKRGLGRVLAIASLVAVAGCGQLGLEPGKSDASAASSTGSDATTSAEGAVVAATLDGREITIAEIDEYMKNSFIEELMSRSPTEIYEVRNKGLQEMIQKQVIEAAAAERGLEPQALFDQVVADVPQPTVEEVARWFAANQSKLGEVRLEQVASRIEELLLNERRGAAWTAFMNERLEALDLQLALEPPRVDLEATRLVRGNADAPVTIMAFSDYQCPYCIRSEPVLAEVLSRFPEQVRVVHRHFPLDSIHPLARPASEAAMCADEQGKFWEYHDAIFARAGRLTEGSFTEIGSEVGLDAEALSTCIAERRYAAFVQSDFEAGRAAGVTGTPAFFVNGVALKGTRNADELSQIVESELARTGVN